MRDHQSAQHHGEQGSATLEPPHGKTIGGKDAGAHLEEQDACGHDDGVPVVLHEVCLLEDVEVVLRMELMGEQGGDHQLHFLCRLKGGGDHPVQGEQHDDGHNDRHHRLDVVAHRVFFVLVELVDLLDQSRIIHGRIGISHFAFLLSSDQES